MTTKEYNELKQEFEWLRYKESYTKDERWHLAQLHRKYMKSNFKCATCGDIWKMKFEVLGQMNEIMINIQNGKIKIEEDIIIKDEKLTEPNSKQKDSDTNLMEVINQKLIELEETKIIEDIKEPEEKKEIEYQIEDDDIIEIEVDKNVKSIIIETEDGERYVTNEDIDKNTTPIEVKLPETKIKSKNKKR